MRIAKGASRLYQIRQQQAAEAGRNKRSETAREAIATVAGTTASIHVDKKRITLARLRFMGEIPDERYKILAYVEGEDEE